jgi:hypothetical protein
MYADFSESNCHKLDFKAGHDGARPGFHPTRSQESDWEPGEAGQSRVLPDVVTDVPRLVVIPLFLLAQDCVCIKPGPREYTVQEMALTLWEACEGTTSAT